jgi:hypothetical protein
MPESTLKALDLVRKPELFQWYLIPMFAIVVYIYAVEIERKNWSLVLAGLTVWGIDWFLEVINSLFLHFSEFSAVWTEVGPTGFQILVGLNIETSFMFAIMGICFGKMLPADKKMKILGLPNRWFFIITNTIFCVFIEVILNQMGYLAWNYCWWNFPNVWLIMLFGYAPYFFFSFMVIDAESMKKKLQIVGTIWGLFIVSLILFGALGWLN